MMAEKIYTTLEQGMREDGEQLLNRVESLRTVQTFVLPLERNGFPAAC
jgi:hypothetical protein